MATPTASTEAYPAELGYPNDHFDLPYTVTTNDAVSITPANSDGVPQPYTFQGNMGALNEFEEQYPDYAGTYALAFMNVPLPSPTMSSLNPAPGSVDLREPSSTPKFAPGTNRLIKSAGPVRNDNTPFSGNIANLYRETPGQNGPVTGGADYAQQLAATFFASQNLAYSQQASAQALVSAV